MTKRSAIALLFLVPLAVSIIWCGLSVSETLGKCDEEGYLVDKRTREELFKALHEFELQHNLGFDYGYAAPHCDPGGIKVTLEYQTPSRFSKHSIIYGLLVSAIYSPHSRLVTLRLNDESSKAKDALEFIDSLNGIIAEFEKSPQVEEFFYQFKSEGIDIRGTVYDDSLWIETDRRLLNLKTLPSMSAEIFYSTLSRSIYHYSLPNRITWHEFPEIPIAHRIINEHLLVGNLVHCVISTEKKAYANTDVTFLTDDSTRVDVKVVCSDTGEDKYVRLILHRDGSYKYEGEK